MEVGGNIISSLGAGSGINSSSIVKQLVEIEKTFKQEGLDADRSKFDAQLSDYSLLKSALSTLQDSAKTLQNSSTFNTKSAGFTDSTAIVPSQLGDDAQVGSYTLEVLAIAQAQSLSASASFATVNSEVGKGELTFSFGEWDAGQAPAPNPPEAFTADASKDAFTVTIDDSNNSLMGLRDAINKSDQGVQASIINDGNAFRLVITSASGASNELQITVAEEGGSPTNTDANGLSRFAFDEGLAGANQQMTQQQAGADASLIVNGLAVTRSSNKIDDVIQGFGFDLIKAAPGEVMSINITEDKSSAEQVVRDFVDTFNAFLEAVKPLTGVDPETEELGSLSRDATTKSIMTGLRGILAQAVPGSQGDFSSLATIGITTNKDGTLSIAEDDPATTFNEDIFSAAFKDNYDDVKALFTAQATSSSPSIEVNGFGSRTVAGSYDVVITQPPSKGQLVGAAASGTLLADLATAGATDFDFTVTVDGVASGTISLTPGSYADEDALAAHIQSQINADSALSEAGSGVNVTWNVDHFEVASRSFGAASNATVVAVGVSAGDLGLAAGTATAGTDVKGTFNGEEGFGIGDVLLGKLKSDSEGLKLIVNPSAVSSTINFSGGFGRSLDTLLGQFLQTNGIIDERNKSLNSQLVDLDTDQEVLDRRIEAYEARLMAQYQAMENIIAGLNQSKTMLTGILDRLPFTSSNG